MENLEQYQESYHRTRFTESSKRDVLWQALARFYFKKIIKPEYCVLDLGAGYGHFINNVQAKKRIALDCWPELSQHMAQGVEVVVADVNDLSQIAPNSVDFVFASNLFEHVSQESFANVLQQLREKVTADGTLNILQPNWRWAYKEYFDDYTHRSVYSHTSLQDFLAANGWKVFESYPRFLPLTVKGRLPVYPLLIWAYLHSPIKPMGKQMLLRARKA